MNAPPTLPRSLWIALAVLAVLGLLWLWQACAPDPVPDARADAAIDSLAAEQRDRPRLDDMGAEWERQRDSIMRVNAARIDAEHDLRRDAQRATARAALAEAEARAANDTATKWYGAWAAEHERAEVLQVALDTATAARIAADSTRVLVQLALDTSEVRRIRLEAIADNLGGALDAARARQRCGWKNPGACVSKSQAAGAGLLVGVVAGVVVSR